MLAYNEIKPKKIIVFNDEPCEVIDSHVFRKQQRKPVNQTKLKSLITGKLLAHSFHQNDKVEEAELEKKNIVFIYSKPGEHWFHEEGNPGERFVISSDVVGDSLPYTKSKDVVEALVFNDEIIGIKVPVKVELEVKEAPPNIKGNTAQGGNKQVVLETGATINVPMFVEAGDKIRINTETGEYTERVS